MHWLLLFVCIVLETVATSLLKVSDGFTKPVWGVAALLLFAVIFYLLSIVFKSIPVGVTYAIWSGVGIVLISLVTYFAFGQKLDFWAMLGIALIVAGVVIINLFSKSTGH